MVIQSRTVPYSLLPETGNDRRPMFFVLHLARKFTLLLLTVSPHNHACVVHFCFLNDHRFVWSLLLVSISGCLLVGLTIRTRREKLREINLIWASSSDQIVVWRFVYSTLLHAPYGTDRL